MDKYPFVSRPDLLEAALSQESKRLFDLLTERMRTPSPATVILVQLGGTPVKLIEKMKKAGCLDGHQ